MTDHLSMNAFERIDEILPGVFLSGARAVKVSRIRTLGITCIINTALELPHLPMPDVDCVKIPLTDSVYVDIKRHFDFTTDKMNDVLEDGGRVLVHCIAGVSRSVTFVLAYLMKYAGMTLREAYIHVKARRSVILPNFGFVRQLVEFERELFGSESVKFVYSEFSRSLVPDVVESEHKEQLSHYRRLGLVTPGQRHRYTGAFTQPLCSLYASNPRQVSHCRLSTFLLQEKLQACS